VLVYYIEKCHVCSTLLISRVSDPYSIGPVDPDPDPYSKSGSGSRRAKMTHKSRKNACFEVLDGLFCELEASSVTWTYFMEA